MAEYPIGSTCSDPVVEQSNELSTSSWEGEPLESSLVDRDDEDEYSTSGFVSENDQEFTNGVGCVTPSKVSFTEIPISPSSRALPTDGSCDTIDEREGDTPAEFERPSSPISRREGFLARSPCGSRSATSSPNRTRKGVAPSPLARRKAMSSDMSPDDDDAGQSLPSTPSSQSNGSLADFPVTKAAEDVVSRQSSSSKPKYKLAVRRQTVIATTGHDPGQPLLQTSCQRSASDSRASPGRSRRASHHQPEPPELPRTPSSPQSFSPTTRRRSSIQMLQSDSFYVHIQVFTISFLLPFRKEVSLECPGNKTVGEIKEMLWDRMRELNIIEYHLELDDPDDYTFKYKKFGTDYELYDQEQLFQTLSIVSYWRNKRNTQPQILVELKKPNNSEARQFQLLIHKLIGCDMEELVMTSNNDEADITRRKFVSTRHTAVSARDRELYAMEPALTHSEVPETIKKACAGWIELKVQFEDQKDKAQEILFQVSETPLDLLNYLFKPETGKREVLGIPESADAYLYTVKVCGKESYLYGSRTLIKYTYIRRCLLRKVPILLAVVRKPDVEDDATPTFGEPDFIDDCSNLTGSHQQLSSLTKVHSQVFTMSLWDIATPFQFKLAGIAGLGDTGSGNLFIEVGIYHGGQLVCPARGTAASVIDKDHVVVNQNLVFDIAACNIPKAARMHIVVYGIKKMARRGTMSPLNSPAMSPNSLGPSTGATSPLSSSPTTKRKGIRGMLPSFPSPRLSRRTSEEPPVTENPPSPVGIDKQDSQENLLGEDHRPDGLEPLYWINMQLLDHRAVLRTGYQRLAMWHCPLKADGERDTSKFSPNSCTSEHPECALTATVFLILSRYAHRVACPTAGLGVLDDSTDMGDIAEEVRGPSKKFLRQSIEAAISASDPLKPLSKMDKDLLWSCREVCKKRPEALPRFLLSLDWCNKDHVLEMHRLLPAWAPLTIEVALQLLDYHFGDEVVRRLAVTRLDELENDDLLPFLLQLVQTLKFEPYHDSALATFLLKRALQSKRIGHNFFWFLRAEMDAPEYRERFGLLLEAYIRGCGRHMLSTIQRQQQVNKYLLRASKLVKEERQDARAGMLQAALQSTDVMKGDLRPVYDLSMSVGDLVIEKCKAMDSKKVPLWLEFANKDPTAVSNTPVKIIFKEGDDLRQDMLTLQMLKLMDKLWQDNGLDLFMLPYGCMSTGHEVGMIEVVLEAETVASIQRKHGGHVISNAMASFSDETLANWLREKTSSRSEYVHAVKRFVLSCAGYCVATYVLGIGDRHNDNIMITKSGNLFHIDFGHFLGNTKKFLGGRVKRELAPFVLTPDFVHIMGKKEGANFQDFVQVACKAYNIIRSHAHLFINLFSMMKCTGIPELTCIEDIDYLRNVLLLDKTDEEAAKHFTKQVDRCLELAWTVRCNFAAHNVKRRA